MYYFIYETQNIIDKKTYIGCHKTDNLEDGYLGSGKLLVRAVKKYKKHNFLRRIIEFCNSEEEMYEKEKVYVNEKYVNSPNTYNLRCGGFGGRMIEEIRKQVSEKLKKPKTIETRLKMSLSRKGKKLSPEHKQKILNAILRRPPISEKTRSLLSLKAKQRKCLAKNSVWITDGEKNKRVFLDKQSIPDGWKRGRTY
jgi:hypothetical protein